MHYVEQPRAKASRRDLGSGEALPPFRPPFHDRSLLRATRCATPAARAAALLKEPHWLLAALESALALTDRPDCPRRSRFSTLALSRPSSSQDGNTDYEAKNYHLGSRYGTPVRASPNPHPSVAAEHPSPLPNLSTRESPHALCRVVSSIEAPLQCIVRCDWRAGDGRELDA